MINYFIYAKDFSSSTAEDEFFHSNGLETLKQFKHDVENIQNELLLAGEPLTNSKIIYLHWGDDCFEVDEEKAIEAYKNLEHGNMWTMPTTIIKWIHDNCENCDNCGVKNNVKLLYIITDGRIDASMAESCFNWNRHMKYESVVFHAINFDEEEIDMSVAASFFKNRCKVYRNEELFDDVDVSEEFDYTTINIDNFKAEKDNLKSFIKLKYIGQKTRDDRSLQEIDKLKELRNRLFATLTPKPKTEINLDTKDRQAFLTEFKNTDWFKNLNATAQDNKNKIEKFFSTLINYIISEKKSYAFDSLKYENKFYNSVEEEPIVEITFEAEQAIEFPDIILDDEKGIPVIILTEFNLLNKIIFHETKDTDKVSPASFNKFKRAIDCPLFLLKDSDLTESIGYFYTLNVYKQLLEKTTRTEPRTRKPFHGGLVLTNTDVFDKYNDYIVAATYFNFKKINYTAGLFYYVLWKNCENKEWMDRNVVEQLKKYTMRRISETKCRIGLSSLPLDPHHNTSLLTALWYCIDLSSCLFKNDPLNFYQERLRMYHSVADYMIEILQYFNYDLELESIEKRVDMIRHVMILKKMPRYEDKVYFLLKNIFKTEKGFLISKIENPSNINKLNYLKLHHKEMLDDEIIKEKVHLNDYIHLMYFEGDLGKSNTGNVTFEICEKTFRPFFIIDENKSFYTELIKITKNIVINNDDDKDKIEITYEPITSLEFCKILSMYNLFINFVKGSKKYPTFEEYIEYIAKRKKYYKRLVTIFAPNTYNDAMDVYELYQNIVSKVDVNTFIEVIKKYVKRSERIKAEEMATFSDDKEITTFISSEESKCGFKKKVSRGGPKRQYMRLWCTRVHVYE